MKDDLKKSDLEELYLLEKKAKSGVKLDVHEHRRILIYRHLLGLISSDIFWLGEV